MLYTGIRQDVQLDPARKTISGHLILIFTFFCYKNENVDAKILSSSKELKAVFYIYFTGWI